MFTKALFLSLAMVFSLVPLTHAEVPVLWDLDGEVSSGTTFRDAGPLGLKVETRGDVKLAEGKAGGGFYFPGKNESHLRVNGDGLGSLGSPFTLSLWVKPEALPPAGHIAAIIGKRREFWQEKPFVVLLADDGALIVETGNGTNNANAILQNSLPLGQWTHIAVTHEADGDRVVYINGEEKNRERLAGTLASNDQAIHIGYESGKDLPNVRRAPFQGWMDEIRGYASAMTQKEVQTGMQKKPVGRAAKASDFAPPVFIGEFLLTRFDRPRGFAQREQISREQAYRKPGPDAVDWMPLTFNGKKYFEKDARAQISVKLRTPPDNRPLFRQEDDHAFEPADIWFRAVLWIWGRRYIYTIEPTTRSTDKQMEIWTFPVKISSPSGAKIESVRVDVGGKTHYERKESLNSLTLLLPRSLEGKPYQLWVNDKGPFEFQAGLEPIEPGNPQEIQRQVSGVIEGTDFQVGSLPHPEEMPNRQMWRQDLAAMAKEGADQPTRFTPDIQNKGFARYLGFEVPRSPILIHNVHMTHGMSGGHFWGSAQGPDALHAANTSFGVNGSMEDYADHLQSVGIDRIIEVANDKVLADTSGDRSVERFFEELQKRGIRGGLNVAALSESSLPYYAWNLPDFWDSKLREMRLLTQRFSSFRSFTALTYIGDNAGYVPYWHWAPPIPNRPWAEATSIFFQPDPVEIPLGPGNKPDPIFNEVAGTQLEFVDYIRNYDTTFTRAGEFGEAAREIRPDLETSTQAFGSSPGVGGEGGWPWSTQPGREIFENFTNLQSYDWDESYSSKPLHNVALLDRLRSYYPDKPAWALLDYFFLKFGPETLRRSYALALTRGVESVGVNWISLPKGQYARPQKVDQDRDANLWAKRMGGVYGGTEPEPTVGVLMVHEQAISRPIPSDRHNLDQRKRGSHEGKTTEAMFLSHAAGYPAKIITPDELKRGLPKSMKAIVLAGLNRFDDTWVWYDGLEPQLKAFTDGGGRIIADEESVAPGEYTKTDMMILAYIRQGEGGTSRPSMDDTPRLIERNRENIAMLRTAMEGVEKPVAFSEDPTIWAIPHRTGTTQYVTVVNQDSPKDQSATQVFAPKTANLTWNTDLPVYDVNTAKRVQAADLGKVDLNETAVRIYALPTAEPVTPTIKTSKGADGFYAALVEVGPGISGTPLELELKGNGEAATLFGSTGTAIRLPVTGNEPGSYELTVRDLLAGQTAKTTFDVADEPLTFTWEKDPIQARTATFLERKDTPVTIALTRSQKKDEAMMSGVIRLKALMESKGRTVTIRGLEPFEVVEHLQTYHGGQRFPQWSTIPEDLVLIGTPSDNALIFDQARGRLLPEPKNGTVAWVPSAFRNGYDALTLFATDADGLTSAINDVEQAGK